MGFNSIFRPLSRVFFVYIYITSFFNNLLYIQYLIMTQGMKKLYQYSIYNLYNISHTIVKMFKKQIIVDAKGHMMGRLASYVAKQLLNGQRIVVVRCEAINISGSLFRNKVKFSEFLRKRLLTNPRRTFIHYRAPSRMLWRTVRGMMPHKTARGAAAMGRLKVFEGVPAPYDTKKREVIPDALRCTKLSSFRKFCRLGDLSAQVGWGKKDLIDTLEQKRKDRAENWHKAQIDKANQVRKALNLTEINKVRAELAQYGY